MSNELNEIKLYLLSLKKFVRKILNDQNLILNQEDLKKLEYFLELIEHMGASVESFSTNSSNQHCLIEKFVFFLQIYK